jgi:predicted MPP superfamily phosphohydrolase
LPLIQGAGSRIAALLPPAVHVALRVLGDRFIGQRQQLDVTSTSLSLNLGATAPAQVRLVLLADFHFDPLCERDYLIRCVETANQLEPDLILLLGDYASHDPAPLSILAEILSRLKARHGIFAIFGNHDHIAGIDAVTQSLRHLPITQLRNQLFRVAFPDGELPLIGFESATYVCPAFGLLDELAPGERAIILCHEPDVVRHTAMHPNAALQLSGHTHGGQVLLPGLGSPLLPRLGKLYVRGCHQLGNCQLYVNRGIGTGHLHVRLGSRPEISLLTVHNEGRR